jgi:PAS domain S-box-containing protein
VFFSCSRERNRVHARKSRLRKKFFLDSLKTNLEALENENKRLKEFIKNTTGKSYDQVSGGSSNSSQDASILEGPQQKATKKLEDIDYQLVQALTISQQNFVVSDPKLADNPIVFASQGFYQLTGYSPQEVIGRNCRFLQGPSTDPDTVAVIRQGIEEGTDTAVCLINYKKDGTPFWNQFFVAPLRGVDGNVVNYIGVQCEVSEKVANASIKSAKQTGAYQGAQGESSSSQFATGIQSVIQGRD